MILNVRGISTTDEELENLDRTIPYNVVGCLVQIIADYNPKNLEDFYKKLQFITGNSRPLNELAKEYIHEKMMRNKKYSYLGRSYFVGATPGNDYTPIDPYQIEVVENPHSNIHEGMLKLFVKSGGSNSLRGIIVRQGKDRNYYIWKDSFIGLLADIVPIEK